MKQQILQALEQAANLKQKLLSDQQFLNATENAVRQIKSCVQRAGTIIACGNGGSACDAMHLTEELLARYSKERPGIRARHLLDVGTITCWANDYNYDGVFARQVQTIARPEDLLIVFSTSGNSPNIIKALEAAKSTKTATLGLLGKDGGKAKALCDHTIIVPSDNTARIQEIHICLVHIFCEALE